MIAPSPDTPKPLMRVAVSLPVVTDTLLKPEGAVGETFTTAVALVDELTVID